MIEMDIEYIKAGDILAKSQTFKNFENESSVIVDLRKGVKLSAAVIKKLKDNFNVKKLWIEQEDINIHNDVIIYDENEKIKSLNKIQSTFNELISSNSFNIKEFEIEITKIVATIIENIRNKTKPSFNSLSNIITKIDSHDSYTYEHSMNSAIYSIILSHSIQEDLIKEKNKQKGTKNILNYKLFEHIAINMLLHDIGKIKISNSILNKKSKLTDDEFKEIMKHPRYGMDLVRKINEKNKEMGISEIPATYMVACLFHHQNYDGTGYPKIKSTDGYKTYKGEEIPLIGRIASITDIFDALTSERPYRKKLSTLESMKILYNERGKKLDPKLTDKFLQKINPFNIGTTVKLNNGDLGVIMGYESRLDPIVRPYMRPIGNEFKKLINHPQKPISQSNYDIIVNGGERFKNFIKDLK